MQELTPQNSAIQNKALREQLPGQDLGNESLQDLLTIRNFEKKVQ